MTTDKHHVRISICDDGSTKPGELIRACARTNEDAICIAQEQNLTVLRDGEGGCIDFYDAEDGPHVASYEADGHGVWIVTVAHEGATQ